MWRWRYDVDTGDWRPLNACKSSKHLRHVSVRHRKFSAHLKLCNYARRGPWTWAELVQDAILVEGRWGDQAKSNVLVFVGIFRVWDGLGSMGSVRRAIVHNMKQHFIDEMNAKVGTESLQVVVTGRDSRQSMSPSFYLCYTSRSAGTFRPQHVPRTSVAGKKLPVAVVLLQNHNTRGNL